MDKKEKWNNFIDTLYLNGIKNLKFIKFLITKTKEKRTWKKSLTVIFLAVINVFYRQGFLDCIQLLKSINIFV